jgi:hypothetical protein
MTDSDFRPNFDRAAAYPELVTLRTALRAHDWAGVRAVYEAADWDGRNLLVVDASEQEGVQSFLREVVARDPDDLVAATMLAVRLVEMGWNIRTGARAKNVSSAQFTAFFEHLREAEQVLISVCARDSGLTSAWYERMVTARGLQLGVSEVRRRYARLTDVTPHFAPAQSQLLQTLCPKWSGDYPTMHAFAAQCAQEAPAGAINAMVVVEGHVEHWSELKSPASAEYLADESVKSEIRAAGERSVLHPDFRRSTGWVRAMSTFALGYSLISDWTTAKRCFTELGPFADERFWYYLRDGAEKAFLRNRAKAMEQG